MEIEGWEPPFLEHDEGVVILEIPFKSNKQGSRYAIGSTREDAPAHEASL